MMKELCPFYMAIGMSYDDFWNGDPEMAIYYRKADELKREQENQTLWLQGMYIYEALVNVAPYYRSLKPEKPQPYPSRPYDITGKRTKKEKENKGESNALAFMESFAAGFNQKFELERKEADVNGR